MQVCTEDGINLMLEIHTRTDVASENNIVCISQQLTKCVHTNHYDAMVQPELSRQKDEECEMTADYDITAACTTVTLIYVYSQCVQLRGILQYIITSAGDFF